MPLPAVLLRLLLVAALILNGVGSAVAGTRMVGGDAIAAHQGGHGACHDHAARHDHGKPHPGTGDHCCDTGLCSCHCLQQAQADFEAAVLVFPQAAHAAAVPSASPVHASPRLPHLIRPPIDQAS